MKILDRIVIEPGAVYIMDRGYIDFKRLNSIHLQGAFFVIRAKNNFKFKRLYSSNVDKTSGIQCDQTVIPDIYCTQRDYPSKIRRIRYFDAENEKHLIFLTNNFTLPARTIARLYRCRWQIELFFKWIKQHLRIKKFYGTSENAVKTQIWIAISVYVLVAIVKKKIKTDQSLYTILQILSITLLEKQPIIQTVMCSEHTTKNKPLANQLFLFD